MTTELDPRTLNRTLLRRQWLWPRGEGGVLDAIEHLVGLQAQSPTAPYVGLFGRLDGFTHQRLSDALSNRSAVRIAVMRNTVHLVSARDAVALRQWVQPCLDRALRTTWGTRLEGVEPDRLVSHARTALDGATMSTGELGRALGAAWPKHEPTVLANAARMLLPLVQVPPRGLWGRTGQTTYATADAWLRDDAAGPRPGFAREVFSRFLAAYGPASVRDVQAWSGLTRLAEIADALGPKLRRYRDKDGVELLDVAGLDLADPDEPVRPIFVAPYDNLILAHADRRRVISDEYRKAVQTKNAVIPGTFLVDGFVAGTWRTEATKKAATLVVTPFRKLPKRAVDALTTPARRLAEFVADAAESHDVVIEAPAD